MLAAEQPSSLTRTFWSPLTSYHNLACTVPALRNPQDAVRKSHAANSARASTFKTSGNVDSLISNPWAVRNQSDPVIQTLVAFFSNPFLLTVKKCTVVNAQDIDIGGVDGAQLRRDLWRLQVAEDLSNNETIRIFSDLNTALKCEQALQVLCNLLCEASGGLYPIAAGLLHNQSNVRAHAVVLLGRLESFRSTSPCVGALNQFLIMAVSETVSSGAVGQSQIAGARTFTQ